MCVYYIYIYIRIHIYIYISPYSHCGFSRVGLEHNLNLKGWTSHVHRGFHSKFESSNVSRDNVSREIGRS